MGTLFLFSILFFLIISSYRWPGFVVSYLFFFQILNNLIFEEAGLPGFKYSTFILLVPILFIRLYSKNRIVNFKRLVFKNIIPLTYLTLAFYIIFHGFLINTAYEHHYIKQFLFPGSILFLLALYFFNDKRIYPQIVSGILIFSFTTLVCLYFFRGITSMIDINRLSIGEEIGMGPIVQGRIAGLLGLTSFGLILHSKKIYSIFLYAILFASSLVWLSLTGSRGPALALIISLFGVSYSNKQILKNLLKISLLVLAIGIIFVKFGGVELVLFDRINELNSTDSIESMARYKRFITFFSMPVDTFVFGLGPGGWGKHVALADYKFPHNIIVEAVVEHGIVGLIFILVVIIKGSRILLKHIHKNYSDLSTKIIVFCWFFYLVNCQVSGSFIQGNTTFFTLTAVMACIKNKFDDFN